MLRPHGTLVFKWSEVSYPLRDVLALTPERPLFGHRTSRNTHWCVFMKEGKPASIIPTVGEILAAEKSAGATPAQES